MTSYISESGLCDLMRDSLRSYAPSVRAVRVEALPGPFRPNNWRVAFIDVLAEDYGEARDNADRLATLGHWILVPDRHRLAGQVFGKEFAFDPPADYWDGPNAPGYGAGFFEDPGYGSVLREIGAICVARWRAFLAWCLRRGSR